MTRTLKLRSLINFPTFLCLVALSPSLYAQQVAAAITGQVTDATGVTAFLFAILAHFL